MYNSTEFIAAAQNGDLRNLQEIYESGKFSDIDDQIENYTALERAAVNNNFECVEYLLDIGCNPYSDNSYAIRESSARGLFSIVEILIENAEYSRSVLQKSIQGASEQGRKDVVKFIKGHLEGGINYKDPNKWSKIDDKSISNSKRDKLTKTTINTIFNFLSSKRTTITKTPGSEITEIEKFSEIEDKEELILAHDKLIAEGGTPDRNKIFASPISSNYSNKLGKSYKLNIAR